MTGSVRSTLGSKARIARRLRALATVRSTPFCSNVFRPPRANGERVASERSRVPSRSDPTRARVATEGFGARLLELQDADGQWASGAFFLAGHDFHAEGQPWTATTWALNTLREWGLDPKALNDTAQWLAENCRWEYDNLPYWDGEVDYCINSWTVANGLWLGATRSSFHSTLNSLKGLLAYKEATGGTEESRAARREGEEYLLKRDPVQEAFHRRTRR